MGQVAEVDLTVRIADISNCGGSLNNPGSRAAPAAEMRARAAVVSKLTRRRAAQVKWVASLLR